MSSTQSARGKGFAHPPMSSTSASSGTSRRIRSRLVSSMGMGWYHTIELAPGQETEGMFDLRPFVDRYGLPESLEGKRCLDVGTWDGFWAFEIERRGGEVVGIDLDDERLLDWPPRRRPKE